MAGRWKVSDVGTEDVPEQIQTFEMMRLNMMAERLKQDVNGGQELLRKVLNEEEFSPQDQLQLNKLKSTADEFIAEVKELAKNSNTNEVNEKLQEFCKLHFGAQDLLSMLKQVGQRTQRSVEPSRTTSRLPKLDLLKFDGDKLKWHEFWDSFTAAVDKRHDLSDADKFSYLASSLEKEAKDIIRGLTITNQNYRIAVDELKEQFGRPEIVMDAHYRALSKIPKSGKTMSECAKTRAEIERHLKVLSSLGEPVNTNNQLRSMIIDKFPENVLYHLRMIMRSKGSSVAVVRQGLKEIINSSADSGDSNLFQPSEVKTDNNFTTETLFSSTSNQVKRNRNESTEANKPAGKKSRVACLFCGEAHFNDECKKYSTVQQRKEQLRNRCFICLSTKHQARDCPRPRDKKCVHCSQTSHNRSLCPTKFKDTPAPTTNLLSQSEKNTVLQTATAEVFDTTDCRHLRARLLFDTGSQKTYVTEAIAKKLKLQPVEHVSLTIYSFGQLQPKIVATRLVEMKIATPNGAFVEISAHVIPHITGLIPSFRAAKLKLQQLHPRKLLAPDTEEDSPADILVGNDFYHSFFSGVQEIIERRLYLLETKIGWVLSGQISYEQDEGTLSFLTFVQKEQGTKNKKFTVPDLPLQDDKIKDLWELECIGIRDSPKIMNENEVIKFFNESTTFQHGRYYVRWPWAQYPSDLPINFGMARGRLSSLLKRTDPSILEQYNKVLQDQLSKGIIEIVSDTTLPKTHPVHYLPHHCVCQENKTTKLRIVYDASSKSSGHCSLNEYLFKGPLMLEELVALLLSFRTHAIGITADVEKAFLQVGLQTADRDVCRFLWVKNPHEKAEGENLIHFRFCRVPFGVISSPYLLAATVKYHLLRQKSRETEKISNNLYVDNLVTGGQNIPEAINLYHSAISAFEGLAMNIREWNSNSKEFLKNIPTERRATEQAQCPSVLGMKWDINQDTLMLAFDLTTMMKPITTKREVLRIVASVYDPCGLVAPLLLPARLFLQNLWLEKFKWDTPLPENKKREWEICESSLKFVQTTQFPRYYFSQIRTTNNPSVNIPLSIELHCFTDASKEAYAAVVYAKGTVAGETVVNVVMSRTRLIPVKNRNQYTIPKLELLGVLIGTRLVLYVQRALKMPIESMYLWTDSTIVLGWLKSNRLLQPFVSKRVSEITSATEVRFRYINSEDNPADLATRPQSSPLPFIWMEGPSFLKQPQDQWTEFPQPTECAQCMVSSSDYTSQNKADTNDSQEENTPLTPTPSYSVEDSDVEKNETRAPELRQHVTDLVLPNTEEEIIRNLQRQHFPNETSRKTSPLVKSLGLFLDKNGLLRCSGRLQNANLPFDQTHPILLPKSDPFTLETIKRIHEENHHVGTSHTLALLRQKYWVPHGRSQVESVLKRCSRCVKYGGGPYKLPPMPPLPAERVQLCSPFTYTGLDYLGPLTTKEGETTQKRWCCIFTCMASRAIRLEMVKDLTAEEFLLCLRRFVATQAPPLLVVSDNAAQFKLIAEIISSPQYKKHNTAWHFIPELSPWQGGFYERLVALVKHCLRRSVDKTLLNDSQLVTILKEIETVLNSRPLTYVGKELDIVLTPSDFMNNCGTHPLPYQEIEGTATITATKQNLIDGWEKGKKVLSEFMSMFQNYYLANLRERAMTPHKQHRIVSKKEPKVGDVVQIWDGQSKNSQRGKWKVGKIVNLLPSHDGSVRTAQVLLDNGTTLNRSISYLYPLELDATDTATQLEDSPREHPNDGGEDELPGQQYPNGATHDNRSEHPTQMQTPSQGIPIQDCTQEEDGMQKPSQETDRPVGNTRPKRDAARAARQTIRRWTEELCSLAVAAHQDRSNGRQTE